MPTTKTNRTTATPATSGKQLPVTHAACHCATRDSTTTATQDATHDPTHAAAHDDTHDDTQDPDGERKAIAVDPEIKKGNLTRLRRVEGQVRGLHKMIEEDRYCADILTQISSVQEALRSVGRELMRNHLKHCAANAISHGGAEADEMYDELVDMIYKSSR